MTQKQLIAFLEKVKVDTALQEKLNAAKSQDDVVSIAKDHGHVFGTEHISQLSEEELERVDGGTAIIAAEVIAVIASAAAGAAVVGVTQKMMVGTPIKDLNH